MTHKEYMTNLKKNDPIQWYELNSDPTNASTDDSFMISIGMTTISLIISGLIIYLSII